MMSRSSSVILVATALAAGLVLGFSLGRGGPVVSAQVGGSLRGQAGSMTPERAARRAAEVGRQDSRIYDQLAKEYELFAHVDRMFELVSKAVSPSVVHIVAQKT
ncbi:MAG: serine protease, partial [Isosphaeraceae bacterium]